MNIVQLIIQFLPFILSQNAKTAPIANEVTKAAAEIEQALGPGTGAQKIVHVVNAAVQAAQAVDELRGSPDDVTGPVSEIVSAAIPLLNAIAKHT